MSDVAVPGTLGAVRYTDRDVLLARADVPVSDVQTHLYSASLTIPVPDRPITVLRGFISAAARVNGTLVKVATTHLEARSSADPAAMVQQAQALQLATFFQGSEPVVIAGDFNSDAIQGGAGPDNTNTANMMVQTYGYTDSWAAANPNDPGPTWPLYLEDQTPPAYFFKPATPFERIDLIFAKGLAAMASSRVIAGTLPPVAASDHAGVLSTFRIEH